MDWQINAQNYKRIYDYLLRKYADVDVRFFSVISKNFVLVYHIINNYSKKIIFTQIQTFEKYLTRDIVSKCYKLIELVPGIKKDELLEELNKILSSEIKSRASLNRGFQYQKRWVISAKTETIYQELERFCQEVYSRDVHWDLQVVFRRNKPVYKIPKDSLNFITSRIIQQKLKSEYGLNILCRNAIIDGVMEILTDHLPKSVIRTDIVEFYESIDSEKLFSKLSSDGYLPINQLSAIKNLLYEYKLISGRSRGLPRGNGISAYLAEVLLKDFDIFVKNLKKVVYYARFVDDIIIIVQEDEINTDASAKSVWEALIAEMSNFSLQLHPKGPKTYIGFTNPGCCFDYLGYHFIVKKNEVKVGISNSKLCRYKEKISTAFWVFYKDTSYRYGTKVTLLRNRLRYLILETRLSGMKNGIKVGLHATYPRLTDSTCLNELDSYLNKKLQKVPKSCSARLQSCNFSTGYSSGKRTHFNTVELKEIVSIWKNL